MGGGGGGLIDVDDYVSGFWSVIMIMREVLIAKETRTYALLIFKILNMFKAFDRVNSIKHCLFLIAIYGVFQDLYSFQRSSTFCP